VLLSWRSPSVVHKHLLVKGMTGTHRRGSAGGQGTPAPPPPPHPSPRLTLAVARELRQAASTCRGDRRLRIPRVPRWKAKHPSVEGSPYRPRGEASQRRSTSRRRSRPRWRAPPDGDLDPVGGGVVQQRRRCPYASGHDQKRVGRQQIAQLGGAAMDHGVDPVLENRVRSRRRGQGCEQWSRDDPPGDLDTLGSCP